VLVFVSLPQGKLVVSRAGPFHSWFVFVVGGSGELSTDLFVVVKPFSGVAME
jgi:hypothetical protein